MVETALRFLLLRAFSSYFIHCALDSIHFLDTKPQHKRAPHDMVLAVHDFLPDNISLDKKCCGNELWKEGYSVFV